MIVNFCQKKMFCSINSVANENKKINERKKNLVNKMEISFDGEIFKVAERKLSWIHEEFYNHIKTEDHQEKDLWKRLKKTSGRGKDCFPLFKQYIQKGCIEELEVEKETIQDLLDVARSYHLVELEKDCEKFLLRESIGEFVQKFRRTLSEKQDLEIVKNDKKEEVRSLFFEKTSSPEILANTLLSHFSDLELEIEKFQNEHPNKLEMLRTKGWNALKKEFGIKMEGEFDPDNQKTCFSDFRDKVNDFVKILLNRTLEELKINPVTVKILGTPGFNSDKDITLESAEGYELTTADMVLVKLLADLITVKVTGTLPGIALDTEWYIHRKFLGEKVTSKEAKHQLVTLDMAMAIVQAKEGLEPKDFKKYKKMQLESSIGVNKEIKIALFEQVEGWYETIELEIGRQLLLQKKCDGNNQEQVWKEILNYSNEEIKNAVKVMKKDISFEQDYYKAKVLSQYPTLLRLGKRCGELEHRIKKAQGENINELIIEHDILYAIINCRQPEGTMSASELKTTLDSKYGQQAARNKEKQISILNEKIQINGGFEIRKKTKVNMLLLKQVQDLKEIEENQGSYPRVSLGGFVSAARERLTQFIHVAKQEHNLINAGKYFLRTIEANRHALKQMSKIEMTFEQRVDVEFLLLTKKPLYLMAVHFEQCKRAQILNAVAFKKMLMKLLEISEEHLEELASKGEPEGIWSKQIMTPQEKIREMAVFLFNRKYISENERDYIIEGYKALKLDFEQMERLNQIRDILLARAGYKADSLTSLHEKAKSLTKEHYCKQGKESVENLIKQVEEFTLEVEKLATEINPEAFPIYDNSFKIDFNKSWIN